MPGAVSSFGQAIPPLRRQAELWDGFFAEHYKDNRVARYAFQHSGVVTRGGVVDPCYEDVSTWGTGARMERFMTEALPLGKEAIGTALGAAGLQPEDVGMLVVASCTGYATPGLHILLARDLAMDPYLRTLMLGHMGCHAAIPGLGVAADYASVHGRPAVLLCLELTSLHLQPAPDIPRPTPPEIVQQMVVHSLFGDAAAAVVITPEPSAGSLEVVEVAALTDTTTADMMTWDVTDLGFQMGLSSHVPEVLARHVRPAAEQLLARHGLRLSDVDGWVVHPGGPRILEAVEEALDLPPEAARSARDVLRDNGNCSSATVLLILDRVRTQVSTGSYVIALAFGPGLTLYATLLRMR